MSHDPNRPTPLRAASLQPYSFKTRATSQPPGGRVPILPPGQNQIISGRGSPSVVDKFGVIGGSRAPGRFAGALATGTQTRASSFSGDVRDTRTTPGVVRTLSSHTEEQQNPSRTSSTSPYPTFSPTSSSPSGSLRPSPPSPPRAEANVSRSRSQSLAMGHRPDRGLFMPLSALETPLRTFDKGWDTSPPEAGNQSPFTRHPPSFGDVARPQRFQHDFARGWGSAAPDSQQSALSNSVAKALGGVQTTVVGRFEGGGKSGASSRRHSVSVVGGFGRRDFFDGQGMTMASPPAQGTGMSPPGPGPGRGIGGLAYTETELLPDRLNNALNLEIDESRRRGIEIELNPRSAGRDIPLPMASSLPFERGFESARKDPFSPEGVLGLGPSPSRGRMASLQPAEVRGASGESLEGANRSRFSFDQQPIGSPARTPDGMGVGAGVIGARPPIPGPGPGAIGGPSLSFDPRFQSSMFRPSPNPYSHGPPSPQSQYQYRPTFAAYPFYPRPLPPPLSMYPPQTSVYPQQPFSPPNSDFPPSPQTQTQHLPGGSSPSFSSLSLSDLGRGLPLTALPPSTPLYIVAFKAGRRDVYYCPDPTLLISTTDRVIVEADRGSDLGPVVYDQLTPVHVREWQERQATAALLSGASQHQPPGMAVGGASTTGHGVGGGHGGGGVGGAGGGGAADGVNGVGKGKVKEGELKGADLNQLLAGCGPSGNAFETGMMQRGPLAKEIMPKRIFAKSAQGPDEQARMLEKRKDEYEAMMICREKVAERGLPMQIVDAEYQWDRRKLTFYFKADRRVDFRELTKENFRIFKSRIWMSMVPRDGGSDTLSSESGKDGLARVFVRLVDYGA